ncbi:MAG: T9SS type A sorting domain-containing protein [bacterium]|jgi:hypothetical protein
MKKIFTIILLFTALGSKAQVFQNGGFESWTNLLFFFEPQGYVTTNYASVLLGGGGLPRPNVSRNSTIKNSGTYSARLESYAANVGDTSGTPGAMVTGTLDLANATILPGFAYSNRPSEFRGFYNYKQGNRPDSGLITVLFTKYDSIAGPFNVVGATFVTLSQTPATGMQSFNVPIFYTQEVTPDTAIIVISTSSAFTGEFDTSALANAPVGSILYVDDLSFFGSVGIENIDDLLEAQVYPNPAMNNLNVNFYIANNSYANIELFSIDGKLVYSEKRDLLKGDQNINLEFNDLTNGIYQLSIQTELGTIRKKINILK